MRYVRAISLVLAALFGVGLIITSGQANAATSAPPPVVPPPGGATLTQGSAGTWTTSVYLDTVALCDDTYNLVTSAPDTNNPATQVTYDGTSTALIAQQNMSDTIDPLPRVQLAQQIVSTFTVS